MTNSSIEYGCFLSQSFFGNIALFCRSDSACFTSLKCSPGELHSQLCSNLASCIFAQLPQTVRNPFNVHLEYRFCSFQAAFFSFYDWICCLWFAQCPSEPGTIKRSTSHTNSNMINLVLIHMVSECLSPSNLHPFNNIFVTLNRL